MVDGGGLLISYRGVGDSVVFTRRRSGRERTAISAGGRVVWCGYIYMSTSLLRMINNYSVQSHAKESSLQNLKEATTLKSKKIAFRKFIYIRRAVELAKIYVPVAL